MMEQHSHSETALFPCPVCREPIRKGAKKCIHCTPTIDWHRWLAISQTTLALLVALVSVVGATALRLSELLTRDYSDLGLNYRQVYRNGLEVEAWNQGNRNAQLMAAKLLAKTHDKKQLELDLEVNGAPPVAAGQEVLFGLTVPPARIADFLGWPHKDIESAEVVAQIQEFRKAPESRTNDVPLKQFQLFCRGTEGCNNQNAKIPPGQDQSVTTHCL
jgi:hypothetical protein